MLILSMNEILKKLDNDYTLRKLKEMIKINSVVGNEEDLAEYLNEELNYLGLKSSLQEVEPKRYNVYARLPSENSERRLNYNGHLDTVPIVDGWDTDPFEPILKEDNLYGLGSCDMKSGIACILTMFKAFADSNYSMNGELSFSAVIDEEAYGKGARAMLSSEYGKVNTIVLAEPYPGDQTKPIPLGITGKILYDIYVKGKAAHAFRPYNGINAIEEASKIIDNLNRLRFLIHPDFKKGNYSTLKFEGGYTKYSVIVPANARFEVNRLLVPGETVQTAIDDMKQLVNNLNLKSTVEVKIKPPQYEAYVMNKDEPILKIFESVYSEVLGKKPLYEYASGITDANIFSGEGNIPCLHLGPHRGISTEKGGGTHEKNEYVNVKELHYYSKMYAMIAATYLSNT
jgi:acetylornithine deacetylase/succinyl-diaminopimelate desuccinylase family protein